MCNLKNKIAKAIKNSPNNRDWLALAALIDEVSNEALAICKSDILEKEVYAVNPDLSFRRVCLLLADSKADTMKVALPAWVKEQLNMDYKYDRTRSDDRAGSNGAGESGSNSIRHNAITTNSAVGSGVIRVDNANENADKTGRYGNTEGWF